MSQDETRKATGKTKLTVNVRDDDLKMLQRRASSNGTTVTEELRKALALTRLATETAEDGGKVLVEDKRGSLRQIVNI